MILAILKAKGRSKCSLLRKMQCPHSSRCKSMLSQLNARTSNLNSVLFGQKRKNSISSVIIDPLVEIFHFDVIVRVPELLASAFEPTHYGKLEGIFSLFSVYQIHSFFYKKQRSMLSTPVCYCCRETI